MLPLFPSYLFKNKYLDAVRPSVAVEYNSERLHAAAVISSLYFLTFTSPSQPPAAALHHMAKETLMLLAAHRIFAIYARALFGLKGELGNFSNAIYARMSDGTHIYLSNPIQLFSIIFSRKLLDIITSHISYISFISFKNQNFF